MTKRSERKTRNHLGVRLCGFFNSFFFLSAFGYIFRGYSGQTQAHHTPSLGSRSTSDHLYEKAKVRFEDLTKQQLKKKPSKRWSSSRVMISMMWYMHKKELILGCFAGALQALLATIARPLMLREIILIVQSEDDGRELTERGMYFAAGISLCVLLEGACQANSRQILSGKMGTKFMSWGMSLVHYKSTTVSSISLQSSSASTSSIVGNDFIRIFEDWRRMCMLPFASVALLGGITILAITLKASSLVGMVIMLMVVLFNFWSVKMSKKVEEKDFERGDERIAVLNELLEGIKAIKLTAWEYPFRDLLFKIRKEETGFLRKYRLMQVTSVNMGRVSPALAGCLTILVLVAVNESDATAANLFVAMTAFLSLRLPLIGLPMYLSLLGNTFVSFQRIGDYLLLQDEENPEEISDDGVKSESLQAQISGGLFSYQSDYASDRDENAFLVKADDFRVNSNEMVAIVGRVGSGKSSLLKSLLGITKRCKGKVKLTDSVGFVPQQAFVLSGTIKENILLGKSFDPEWFQRCIEISEFTEDLNQMSQKENMPVGERGQTLSGGQQQRLAICRALYSRPKLLIMDDPLSAVDPIVAQKIFFNLKRLFSESLDPAKDSASRPEEKKSLPSGASLLMTLNQFHFLTNFSKIFVMKAGEIIEQGSYDQLLLKEGGEEHFRSMVEAVDVETIEEEEHGSKESNKQDDSEDLQSVNNDFADEEESLVQADFAKRGAVGFTTCWKYISAMGPLTVPISLFLGILTYGIYAFNDKRIYTEIPRQDDADEMLHLAYIYLGLSLAHVFFLQSLSYHHCFSTVRASNNLHNDCIENLLHAPITWFESNPSGRIVSRFSGDLAMLDRTMQFIFDDFVQFMLFIAALAVVVCIILPIITPVILIGICVFFFGNYMLDRTNREVKRYANQNLAPVLTNVSETLNAKTVIQAMKAADFFTNRHRKFIDDYIAQLLFCNYLNNWLVLMAAIISFSLAVSVSMITISRRGTIDAADAGLALTYSFLMPYFLQFMSVQIVTGLSCLTSLERVLEYMELPQEPAWEADTAEEIEATQSTWPSKGTIAFQNVTLVYRRGLDPALKNITFTCNGGEKIGVVGRTGAGKSSLTLLLFRVYECTVGKILIDGVDISKIGLQTLRKNLSSIPQHPLLLRGTVRKNLDPFEEYPAEKLDSVMSRIGLGKDMEEMAASDLSTGQRQLISLGRILLKNEPKIIVMDEPTANIDQETDQAIQRLVRQDLNQATLITIAHRLETVIDSDKILVMDAGEVKEFDSPSALLSDPKTIFSDLVKSLGEPSFQKLKERAEIGVVQLG